MNNPFTSRHEHICKQNETHYVLGDRSWLLQFTFFAIKKQRRKEAEGQSSEKDECYGTGNPTLTPTRLGILWPRINFWEFWNDAGKRKNDTAKTIFETSVQKAAQRYLRRNEG